MKYKKIEFGSYNLHLINTDKFKTITVKINFKRKIKKSEITKRSLLARVLLESSKNYQSSRLLEIKTEDLYNLLLDSSTNNSGEYTIFSLLSTFLIDKYTEPDQIKNSIDFLLEILLNPNVENGEFNKDSFNLAYASLKQDLLLQKDNPDFYSGIRVDEETDKKAPYSFNAAGYLEDLEQIDEKNLYTYYKSMLRSDLIDIFVIGNFNEEEIKKQFFKYFKINTVKKPSETHIISHKAYRKRIKTVIEKKPYEQSKLIINCKTMNLTSFEMKYVVRIFSFILGGGPNSKLFKEVREKNSLCYSIRSSYGLLSNMLKIKAGINKENFRKTTNLIKKELKKIGKGEFSEEDINQAKTTYISTFENITDSPYSIIGVYESHEYLSLDLIDERIKNINKVTKKIHIDTIYLLEGDTNE